MSATLSVSIGQYSHRGRKDTNQDFHGALIPEPPLLHLKGMVLAIADGISSSPVSAIAAETAIKSFLTDYYCTADSWPVRTAAQRVIAATNAWLHAQGQRSPHPDDPDRGFVCTLSALVLKARSAHIFHIGDSRIARLAGRSLEPLTNDHRMGGLNGELLLARGMGLRPNVEIDYAQHAIAPGDVFVLSTDGVHEFVDGPTMADAIALHEADLDGAARAIAQAALARGSGDNLTIQIVRIEDVPLGNLSDHLATSADLPAPPRLEPRDRIDGMTIIRQLHGNERSSVYLARDNEDDRLLVIKVPAPDGAGNADYLRRFRMEEWIARRLTSPHVLASVNRRTPPSATYLLTEYVEGQTLTQWMRDHRQPDLTALRDIIGQIAKGLTAFHRQAMVHQDLRPDNVMIDADGTVRIIDFGSTSVAGIDELDAGKRGDWPGTLQYTAPECLLGAPGAPQSDLYSLGTIAYQMLTGRLPYGAEAARVATPKDLRKLHFEPIGKEAGIPAWVEAAIERAVQVDPRRRHEEVAEFVHDLHHPAPGIAPLSGGGRTLAEQLRFWQTSCLVLACAAGVLLILLLAP